jgi:signal peptidase I
MRVIGIEGDRLERSGDDLLVNGVPAGKCLMRGLPPLGNMKPVELPAVVPPGKLFVLGDNCETSLDSRLWGYADANQVIGLAVVIYASATPAPIPGRFMDNPPVAAEKPNRIRWERIGKAIK